MTPPATPRYTAFDEGRRVASGSLPDVAVAVREAERGAGPRTILVFDDATGRVVDLNLDGSAADVRVRYEEREALRRASGGGDGERRRPGRPRLGVVSREVTLLPRHWAWLAAQRGGASATLRRLVDRARRDGESGDRARAAQDATYRFLSALAGDLPGFEEAIRAVYRSDEPAFASAAGAWPDDLRAYARRLAEPAFAPPRAED